MYRVLGTDGKEYGPVTPEQIKQWIVERRLNANSMVQTPESPGWRPLTMFPEFTSTLASVVPAPLSTTPQAASVARTNNMATWGLGLSCFSIVCCCSPAAVLGVVFSCIGLSQANRDPAQTGKPIAIAGIVVGGLSIVANVLALVFGAFGEILDKLLKH
jgi:hypothetical protein